MSHIIKLIALQHTHLPATIQRSCGKFSCGSLIVWLFSSKILLPLKLKKKFCGTFLWMGFNYLKAAERLRGGCLLFLPLEAPGTHFLPLEFPETPGARFIDLGRMKGWVDLGAIQWFLNTGPLDWESGASTTRLLLAIIKMDY